MKQYSQGKMTSKILYCFTIITVAIDQPFDDLYQLPPDSTSDLKFYVCSARNEISSSHLSKGTPIK